MFPIGPSANDVASLKHNHASASGPDPEGSRADTPPGHHGAYRRPRPHSDVPNAHHTL